MYVGTDPNSCDVKSLKCNTRITSYVQHRQFWNNFSLLSNYFSNPSTDGQPNAFLRTHLYASVSMHFDLRTHQLVSHPSLFKKSPLRCLIYKGSGIVQTYSGNYTKYIYPLSLGGKLYSSVIYKRWDPAYSDISHVPGVTLPPYSPCLADVCIPSVWI